MTKPRNETWFEAKLDIDLAMLLNRIVKVHERLGRQRQQEFRERIAAAIPAPREEDTMTETSESRIVSFDLMPKEPDYYFVLTEALRDFAARQRAEAGEPGADAETRIRWAMTAEEALEQIEEALSMPATIEDVVAASIEHQSAYRNELRHLPGYMTGDFRSLDHPSRREGERQ